MKDIEISIKGLDLEYDLARDLARCVAGGSNRETSLVAWFDKKKNNHSPCCVKCEIGDRPGWEVYGENHGGAFRIVLNEQEYVFIYS